MKKKFHHKKNDDECVVEKYTLQKKSDRLKVLWIKALRGYKKQTRRKESIGFFEFMG